MKGLPINSGGQQVTLPRIPDFMAIYGPDIDGLVHNVGAESPEIGPLVEQMDATLGALIQATKDAEIFGQTAFVMTGDHSMSTWLHSILNEVVAAVTAAGFQPEVVAPGHSAAADTNVVIVEGVRVATFLLRGAAATDSGRAKLRSVVAGVDHVSKVFDASALSAVRASNKLGDLVAEAEVPWNFSTLDDGVPRGSHGSSEELSVPIILSGQGIRPKAVLKSPGLVDIAPTIAALLGTRPPADAQGRALREAFVVP